MEQSCVGIRAAASLNWIVMTQITRRHFLQAAAAASLSVPTAALAQRATSAFGSAAQIEFFRTDPRYREALLRYCDVIVPMNDLKWEALRHTRDGFDFSGADELIGFARNAGKTLRGHTLVWGDALPPWAKEMKTAAEAERELIRHIETVVDRYKGVIASWDVVNEVIAHDPLAGAGALRDTIWLRLLGPGYIETAFRTAARVDPSARLVLNDYDFENPDPRTRARREEAIRIIRRLKDKGIPIHTVGFQAHLYGERDMDGPGLQKFCLDLSKLDVGTVVTELDVIDWRFPPEPAARDQAAANLVQSFLSAMSLINRPEAIITWGMSDANSWISTTFKRDDRRPSRPLPLDVNYKPKPMMKVIEQFTRARV